MPKTRGMGGGVVSCIWQVWEPTFYSNFASLAQFYLQHESTVLPHQELGGKKVHMWFSLRYHWAQWTLMPHGMSARQGVNRDSVPWGSHAVTSSEWELRRPLDTALHQRDRTRVQVVGDFLGLPSGCKPKLLHSSYRPNSDTFHIARCF